MLIIGPRLTALRAKQRQQPRKPPELDTLCVITSHNYGCYLAECLHSVASQSRSFSRVMVVDDASSDNTRAIAEAHFGVQYLRGEWRDVAAARNAGATGEEPLLLFVDADDVLPPDYHERLYTALQTAGNATAGAYCGLLKFRDDADGRHMMGASAAVRPYDPEALRGTNHIPAPTLVRRVAYEQAGGWPVGCHNGFQDWQLWLTCQRLGWHFAYVPDLMLGYRDHEASMSQRRHYDAPALAEPVRHAALIAIITLFAGRRWALAPYFRALDLLDWDHGNLHLVALDNSGCPAFGAQLRQRLENSGVHYSIVTEPKRATDLSAAELGDGLQARVAHGAAISRHLARLYAVARAHMPAGADLVWAWEDDVEPPPDALTHLTAGLRGHLQADVCAGLLRSRFDPLRRLIALGEDRRCMEAPEPGTYARAASSGFYCTLFRRGAFDALCFRPAPAWDCPVPPAYDLAAAADVAASGRGWLVSGSVRCRHWQSDGTALDI